MVFIILSLFFLPFPLSPNHSFLSLFLFNRLPKIKAWIDEHNPGDNLIPFSVALEERLMLMSSDEEREKEQKEIGATSALGKITQAGYQSLDVRSYFFFSILIPVFLFLMIVFCFIFFS